MQRGGGGGDGAESGGGVRAGPRRGHGQAGAVPLQTPARQAALRHGQGHGQRRGPQGGGLQS